MDELDNILGKVHEYRKTLAQVEERNGSANQATIDNPLKTSGEQREKIERIDADLSAIENAAQLRALTERLAKLEAQPQFVARGATVRTNDQDSEYAEQFARTLFSLNRRAFERLQEQRTTVSTGTSNAPIPVEWQNRIVEKLQQISVMRTLCPVRTVAADQRIAIGNALPTTYKVTEGATITEDTTNSFGSVVSVDTYMYANHVPLTKQYEMDAIGGRDYIVRKCGESLALKIEDEYTNSASSPTGLLTAITAGQKIAATGTAATVADIDGDNIIDCVHKVKPQYRQGARWSIMLADDCLKAIRKLKLTSGEYIWKVSDNYSDIRDGVPGTIYGVPYRINQYVPIATAANLAFVVGNFEYFEIYDRGPAEIMIDPYSLATSLKTNVIMSMRTEGVCVNTDAFAAISL